MKMPFTRRGTSADGDSATTECLALRLDSGMLQAALVRAGEACGDGAAQDDEASRPQVVWIDREPLIRAGFIRVEEPADGSAGQQDILVEDSACVIAAMTRLLGRRGVAHNAKCVWLLSSAQYHTEVVDAPADVPRNEWAEACRWSLAENDRTHFPDPKLAVIDLPMGASYRVQAQVLAFEASERILSTIQALFKAQHRNLHAIDVPESAQRNLSLLTSRRQAAQALVRVGRNHLSLLVTWNGQTLWVRRIEFDSAGIDRVAGEVDEAAVEQLALELRRTIDAFDRTHTQVSLARLIIMPFRQAEGVAQRLKKHLQVSVGVLDLSSALKVCEGPDTEDLAEYLHVVAAGLRGCQLQRGKPAGTGEQDDPPPPIPHELSFIEPQSFVRRRGQITPAGAMRAAAVLSLGLPLAAAGGMHAYAYTIRNGLDEQASQLARSTRSAVQAMTLSAQAQSAAFQARLAEESNGLTELQILERHLASAGPAKLDAPHAMLAGLADARLAGLWITELEVDLRGNSVHVAGRTDDPEKFTRYVQSPAMREVFAGQPFDQVGIRAEVGGKEHAWEMSRGKPARLSIDTSSLTAAPVQATGGVAPAGAAFLPSLMQPVVTFSPSGEAPQGVGVMPGAGVPPAPGPKLPSANATAAAAVQAPAAAAVTGSGAAAQPRATAPVAQPSTIELKIHTDPVSRASASQPVAGPMNAGPQAPAPGTAATAAGVGVPGVPSRGEGDEK